MSRCPSLAVRLRLLGRNARTPWVEGARPAPWQVAVPRWPSSWWPLLRPSCCARGGGGWASTEARGGGCTCGGCSASKSGELFLSCLLGCFGCTRLSLPPPTSRTRHPFAWPGRLSLWCSAAVSRLGLLLPHCLLSPSTPPLSFAAWAVTCSPDRHSARPGPPSSPLCSYWWRRWPSSSLSRL